MYENVRRVKTWILRNNEKCKADGPEQGAISSAKTHLAGKKMLWLGKTWHLMSNDK